jgi:Glycosyl hydrolase family 52
VGNLRSYQATRHPQASPHPQATRKGWPYYIRSPHPQPLRLRLAQRASRARIVGPPLAGGLGWGVGLERRAGLGWGVDLALLIVLLSFVLASLMYLQVSLDASAHVVNAGLSVNGRRTQEGLPAPGDIRLDSRLPLQTMSDNAAFTNVNAKFGSRFDFTVQPGKAQLYSGTEGVFHDNAASYVVGAAPSGEHKTFIFHMGALDSAQGDAYVQNEHWIQGLDTTRWEGDTGDGSGLHITVDLIDSFLGEPGCTAISACASAVRDDTVPVFIVGVSLQNQGNSALTGMFLFGSNRPLSGSNACIQQTTPEGNAVRVLSYASGADAAGGTLFLAGASSAWNCNTSVSDRTGLAWNYSVAPLQTSTAYLILGGWNGRQDLFQNTQLPTSCQLEGLYAAKEWSSQQAVVNFAVDNLSAGDRLLARAQAMENLLIQNNVLTPAQRWVIADSLRSYKASSWLVGRNCPGGSDEVGYDAAVYEGTYGFLTTVDVMHEYGYFEINRVPWFFKSALDSVLKNATSDAFGVYFQHDQGADMSNGSCVTAGKGLPTIRSTCYTPPQVASAAPMPVEENDNVALLLAYYASVTGDTAMVAQHIQLIDEAMMHNIRVGDPATGIAYNGQDTATTFDGASDCLHNNGAGAGNLYYQGLKEATGYRAAAFLDSLVPADTQGATWNAAAARIENAMISEYNAHGYLPLAGSAAFTNCEGRSVVLGEGLFYAHLIGVDRLMSQELLHDLAKQYLADLQADTLNSSSIVTLQSSSASGPQCSSGHCLRYEWFSKVMLSGIIADLVYTRYGCSACTRLDLAQEAFKYNASFSEDFGDGLHDDGSDWSGHFYPRGIISWALLDEGY